MVVNLNYHFFVISQKLRNLLDGYYRYLVTLVCAVVVAENVGGKAGRVHFLAYRIPHFHVRAFCHEIFPSSPKELFAL